MLMLLKRRPIKTAENIIIGSIFSTKFISTPLGMPKFIFHSI